jgi:hypothetical protein
MGLRAMYKKTYHSLKAALEDFVPLNQQQREVKEYLERTLSEKPSRKTTSDLPDQQRFDFEL